MITKLPARGRLFPHNSGKSMRLSAIVLTNPRRPCKLPPMVPTESHLPANWIVPVDMGNRIPGRILGGLVSLFSIALLLCAATLSPDARGFGTHEQLGMGPCLAPIVTGYPCPTCGMTTAFACTVRGRWISAFLAQPAGLLFALLTCLIAVFAGYAAMTGRTWQPNPRILSFNRLAVLAVVVWLLGWGVKVAIGRLSGTLPIW